MPFIVKEQRPKMDELIAQLTREPLIEIYGVSVGEWCYRYYKPMVDAWKKEPRWTTAHNIYRELVTSRETIPSLTRRVAAELAWQVFFTLYVMPYELKKREENGDI